MGRAAIGSIVLAIALLGACSTPISTKTGASIESPIFGSWRIEDVDSGGVIDSSRLEIRFDTAGRVFGHAGCNTFTGPYTHQGSAIDIGPLASTRRACAAEALTMQEARVLRSLDAVTALAVAADGAVILSGPRPARLLLRRMDEPLAADDGPAQMPDPVLRATARDADAAVPTWRMRVRVRL